MKTTSKILLVLGIAVGWVYVAQYLFTIPSIIMSVVVAPFLEEFIFRYGMVGWTKDYPKFRETSIIVSSFVFGLAHGSVVNIYFQGVGGYLLGQLYTRTNYNYLAVVLTHSLYNLIATFLWG